MTPARRPRPLARILPLAALALACAMAAGAEPAARLVPARSEIAFTTRQMGVPVEGRFGRFDARIALDPAHPERGHVELTLDTASARFGSAELDGELARPAWLDAAHFPQARFESSSIRATGPGRFEVGGRLTIKGTTRELVVPVELTRAPGGSVASGRFTVPRLAYRIGDGEWGDTSLVADEVQVRFRLAVDGLAP